MKKLEDLNRLENEVRAKDNTGISISPIVLILGAVLGLVVIVVLVKLLVFPASPRIPQVVETYDGQQDTSVDSSVVFEVSISDSASSAEEPKQVKSAEEFTDIPEDTVLMAVDATDTSVFGGNISRDSIRKVTFVDDSTDVPVSAWDISQSQNGTIMAWVEKSGLYYNLFIASRNTISVNADCSGLFSGYKNAISISFGTYIDTSNATNMSSMFEGCESLQKLDLSMFDTQNVKQMDAMFSGCKGLKELNISSFDISSVESMEDVLQDCPESTIVSASPILNYDASGQTVQTNEDTTDEEEVVIADSALEGDSSDTSEEDSTAIHAEDQYSVGTIVTLGSYMQASEDEKAPIEWIILERDGRKALVISKYGLSIQKYNTSYDKVTWKTSSIRKWLNESFMQQAFNSDEQNAIITTTVNNSSAQGYSGYGDGGANTEDKIFLLSYAEAYTRLFSNDGDRVCELTPYAFEQAKGYGVDSSYQSACGWWLRSPGVHQYYAMQVLETGESKSIRVNYDAIAVRPAMWINLDSEAINP